MLAVLEEVKLALAAQGVPPELLDKVVQAGADLQEMIQTAAARNMAEEIAAKVRTARDLAEMARWRAQNSEADAEYLAGTERISELSSQLLAEVEDLLQHEEETPLPEPEPPGPLAAA